MNTFSASRAARGALCSAALLVAAAIAAPRAASAQDVDRARPPTLGPAPALRLPAIQSAVLPNGLRLFVVEMHEVPVVDVTLSIDAGAGADPADLPGLATFTAGMLDEGAGRRAALEIAEETDFLGARLQTGAGFDIATVYLHVPKRQLGPALDLMADVALRPTFADSEVTRQRELRRTAIIQQRDQPNAIATVAFPAIVFGNTHPYGHPTGGTEASTAALTRDRVLEFYRAYYRPSNARLLIVGDVTIAEARSLATARFGGWERAEPRTAPATAAPPVPAPRTIYIIDKPGAAQSVIRIGHVGVARNNPDYFAIEVMNTILGGSFTSRLNQNLRETHGYTYGANSGFAQRRMPGPFTAASSVQSSKTDSALIEFMRELRRIRDEAVPQTELDKAKSYLALGMPGNFETTAGAAGQFGQLLTYGLPLDYYGTYIQRINAVTAADVQRVARQYLNPDQFVIAIVGDRASIEAGLRALGEGPITYRDIWGQEIR